jgi:predicted neuraminidase
MIQKTVISTKGPRQWQGIPTIERSPNGRLWCAFFSGGPLEPHEDNYLLLTTSDDEGETWAEPQIIVEREGQTRVFDPCLWHDPDGKLWLFFNQGNRQGKDHTVWAITAGNSAAAVPNWSPPEKIDLPVPFAFRLNKPTVLTSGDWLLPVTWARSTSVGGSGALEGPGDSWFPGKEQRRRGFDLQGVAVSADRGSGWSFHGAVEAPEWALENMLLERTNGTLLMLTRTGAGVLWQSTSADGGRTWSAGTPSTIINPDVRFCLRRVSSGRVLLINTPHPRERTGLRAYLSERDDGSGFAGGLELDDRTQVSYPDAVQADDGTLYTVHDHDRQGVGEILFCRFTEEDVPAEG